MIRITIPIKTPTINHIYFTWNNRRILTKEAKVLKEQIDRTVKKQYFFLKNIESEAKLNVEVDIYENWLTKKGKIARKDIANREKFLIDSVFNALEIDDKFIWIHKMQKIQSETEKAVIKIEELDEPIIRSKKFYY